MFQLSRPALLQCWSEHNKWGYLWWREEEFTEIQQGEEEESEGDDVTVEIIQSVEYGLIQVPTSQYTMENFLKNAPNIL